MEWAKLRGLYCHPVPTTRALFEQFKCIMPNVTRQNPHKCETIYRDHYRDTVAQDTRMQHVVHVGKPCMLANVYMYRVCILAMEDVSCLLHKITNPYISLLRDSWSYNHTRTNCIPLVCLSALYAGCAANIYVHKYSILVEALERLQSHCDHTLEPLSAAGTQRTQKHG